MERTKIRGFEIYNGTAEELKLLEDFPPGTLVRIDENEFVKSEMFGLIRSFSIDRTSYAKLRIMSHLTIICISDNNSIQTIPILPQVIIEKCTLEDCTELFKKRHFKEIEEYENRIRADKRHLRELKKRSRNIKQNAQEAFDDALKMISDNKAVVDSQALSEQDSHNISDEESVFNPWFI